MFQVDFIEQCRVTVTRSCGISKKNELETFNEAFNQTITIIQIKKWIKEKPD